jgi:aldose 1-epimerase
MSIETVTLHDPQAGTSAEVLAGFGFNCYRFQARVDNEPVEVLWSPPGFESGTLRPSQGGIPLLFPFPGRLRGNELKFGGQTYDVGELFDHWGNAIHGYVASRSWQVLEQSPARVVGEFHAGSAAPGLVKKWPADFRITVTYELIGNRLTSELRIANPGDKPLPFGLGTHPYFRLPLGAAGQAADCRITVPVGMHWPNHEMLPTGEQKPVTDRPHLAEGMAFSDSAFDDVYSDLGTSGGIARATIHDPAVHRTLTIAFDAAFKACVVFNPPHREAICIEPYSCIPDAFHLAERGIDAGLRILPPGESLSFRIEIALT